MVKDKVHIVTDLYQYLDREKEHESETCDIV